MGCVFVRLFTERFNLGDKNDLAYGGIIPLTGIIDYMEKEE